MIFVSCVTGRHYKKTFIREISRMYGIVEIFTLDSSILTILFLALLHNQGKFEYLG